MPGPGPLGTRRGKRMGQAGSSSSNKPGSGLPPRSRCRCLVDLTPLPEELLAAMLSWVPARLLATRCRLVCRRWRDLIDGPTVWRLQLERRSPGKWAALAAAARSSPELPWARLCVLQPLERNLLRNPCGKDAFLHWEVEHGGDGWNVEENRCPLEGAEAQTCFVSSFQWCTKLQLVDLLKEGLWVDLLDTYQPEIYIFDWWGGRNDCGCVYSIHVRLLAADKKSVLADFEAHLDPIEQWNDTRYHQVSHVFQRYGPGVRYVHFLHRGKDTQYWKGHYGARITNSTVMVKIS